QASTVKPAAESTTVPKSTPRPRVLPGPTRRPLIGDSSMSPINNIGSEPTPAPLGTLIVGSGPRSYLPGAREIQHLVRQPISQRRNASLSVSSGNAIDPSLSLSLPRAGSTRRLILNGKDIVMILLFFLRWRSLVRALFAGAQI